MSVRQEVIEANSAYAENFGTKGSLALPPARQFAILTCMDARLDPAKVDARAKRHQAEVLAAAGGWDFAWKRGDLPFSPPPGVAASWS